MVTPRERIYHFFCVSAHGIRKINFRAIFRGNVLPSLKASKYSTYKTSPGEREREREREKEKKEEKINAKPLKPKAFTGKHVGELVRQCTEFRENLPAEN